MSEWRSTFAGSDGLSPNDVELPQAEPRFGALPLVVLTPSDIRAAPGQTLRQAKDVQAVWQARHDALAAASTRGMSVRVAHSGHFIQDDQPPAVIRAVRDVVAMARRD